MQKLEDRIANYKQEMDKIVEEKTEKIKTLLSQSVR